MSRILWALPALPLLFAAGSAAAHDWRCGATATLGDDAVGVFAFADDHGKLKLPDGASVVEYTPGPRRRRLELTFGYGASLKDNAVFPIRVTATVPVKRDAADGQIVVSVGNAKTSYEVLSRFLVGVSEFTMWIDLPPDRAMLTALKAGGPGRISLIAKDGQVLESQELKILSTAELLPIVAKAYPVAVGYAAAPQHSPYCEANTKAFPKIG
jgi:hypothetical protein